MSRAQLVAFVIACLVWLLALGAMATDDPNPYPRDELVPATAPGVSPVPASIEGEEP